MAFDFSSWTRPTASRAKEVLQQDYIAYAHDVTSRFESDDYQKVVTYCLLKAISPAVTAQLIKSYITMGKLPWSK